MTQMELMVQKSRLGLSYIPEITHSHKQLTL